MCHCGVCGRNKGPWGQSGPSSQTRKKQVAIPVTMPFLNISAHSEHGANTFTAPLGNLRPAAGLYKSLWWQVTLAESGTVCPGALPGHTGQICGQTWTLTIKMLLERNTQTGGGWHKALYYHYTHLLVWRYKRSGIPLLVNVREWYTCETRHLKKSVESRTFSLSKIYDFISH